MGWKLGERAGIQNPLKALYPDQCLTCGALVEGASGLCPACWGDTPFAGGLACDACAVPLMGEAAGVRPLCDECLEDHPPWSRGRTVMAYHGNARRLVLMLKHGDRLDVVRPASAWMAHAGREILTEYTVLVPVPLHWTRLVRRRFNQAAVLAAEVARIGDCRCIPDALIRSRRTRPQEHMTRAERTQNLEAAIRSNPARQEAIRGAQVVLVDDVMTSGATMRACAGALADAGVGALSVLTLSRVVKDGRSPI